MSFSSEIKKELAERIGTGRHCQLAELSAVISFTGNISLWGGSLQLKADTENEMLKKKYRLLLSQLFQIKESKEVICGESWRVSKCGTKRMTVLEMQKP